MNGIAGMKASFKSWLSHQPWLLELVCHALGKPHAEIALLRGLIRPGDVVFDVGANAGQYTCLFGHLVGPTGAVHAFEPVPPTYAELERNLARHAKGCRIFPNQCAVGDKNGLATLYVPWGVSTEAALTRHTAAGWQGRESAVDLFERCPMTTLDDYVAEHGIDEITLIKCDVEGAELQVLRGARAILRSHRPPLLFLEAWPAWTADFGYQPRDLFQFLQSEAGYEFYHINRQGLSRIEPQTESFPGEFPDFLNFLCVVPTRHRERLGFIERSERVCG